MTKERNEWKTELSHHSIALKSIYFIKEKLNSKKYKTLTIKISPFMKKYLVDNFQSEISNIENESKVSISFIDDITIDNSEINIAEVFKADKKNEKKPKKKVTKKRTSLAKKKSPTVRKAKIKDKNPENQITSPMKEIENKKSGWWQK